MLSPALQAKADAHEKQIRQKLCIWLALENLFFCCIALLWKTAEESQFRFHETGFFDLIWIYLVIIPILLILPVLATQSKIIYALIEGIHVTAGLLLLPLGLIIMLRFIIYEVSCKSYVSKEISKEMEHEKTKPPI